MKNKSKDLSLDEILITTGAMAKALNVNQRTLRLWDKAGILVPQRSDTNRRLYTLSQVDDGKLVLFVTKNLLLDLVAVKLFFAIFEKENIKIENRMNFLKEIAKKAGITEKIQKANIEKWNSRGVNKKEEK